ncbi:hypothetical protein IB231_13585 [Pantoea sp. PNT02]|uniref:hypothetical protein n=1 Tax=Pantoea TaxID=53335 RepID=UPI00177E11DC|nr:MULTISPECIES: hypothetical protein [Pantoea]MBD9644648.1 hypothetical protein [Pantoea sp. PNT02]MBD9659550.1 hypothetical protein [Pantoea sp. PNT03]WFL69649.1 hypothetical protein P6287_22145 [Pantoea sp. X85]
MTALLVFSRNFAIEQAVTSLTLANGKVFYFDSRLEFLVSATVLSKSYILIDTIGESSENIRWIYYRLEERGLLSLTYFIAPEENADNVFLKSFRLVTSLKDLKQLCERASKFRAAESSCVLKDVLYQRLSTRLSNEHLNFLLKVYDKSTRQYRIRNKCEVNKNYYLRNRLALGSGLEMKQLILLLSSQSPRCS